MSTASWSCSLRTPGMCDLSFRRGASSPSRSMKSANSSSDSSSSRSAAGALPLAPAAAASSAALLAFFFALAAALSIAPASGLASPSSSSSSSPSSSPNRSRSTSCTVLPPPPLPPSAPASFGHPLSYSFAASAALDFSARSPLSMVRNNCPRRKVYPASSSRLRPSSSTSVNADPHRSISSSVARNSDMRSPSDTVARSMNGTCTKMLPTSNPWNLLTLSATDFLIRCRACHRCVTTKFLSPSSKMPISRVAPPSSATSSAWAMSRACVCRNPPSSACSFATILPRLGDIWRSTEVMKICAAKSASGRLYPSSLAASVRLSVNSKMGLNECPYRDAASLEKASISATIRWSTLSSPPSRSTAVR
mmetsp:Transcript_16534/g.40692  ORF Transcript_16534/g.40692 Transcript_16534/m.40692 type:complete len:365 (-) Transcript_16534:792-1886(-)